MELTAYEVPVAYSMVELATDLLERSIHPMQVYTCYWTAFNNIYVKIAEQEGLRARLRRNRDGSIRMVKIGQISVPWVISVSERDQIDLAFRRFPAKLKRDLVEHPNVRFFVDRTPRWRGRPIERDRLGQRLNGVLNVGYTVDENHPVWAPIDTSMFEQYQKNPQDSAMLDNIARQILYVLYAVRNNTLHGGKRADDASDQEVLEKALPLLKIIVLSFL